MERAGRRGWGLAGLVAGLLVAACGSGSSLGGGSGASHDSPDGAVRGLFGALQGYDGSSNSINAVLDWIPPQDRDRARSGLAAGGAQTGLKVNFKIANFDVSKVDTSGDKAAVHVTGQFQVCYQGAVGGQNLATCSASNTGPFGSTSNCIPAVRVSGQWYVNDNGDCSGSGASSSSSASTPSSSTATSSSATDTGTGSSTDTGTTSSSTTTTTSST